MKEERYVEKTKSRRGRLLQVVVGSMSNNRLQNIHLELVGDVHPRHAV